MSGGNAGEGADDRPHLTRRQALGRMSAVATAGAAAWVVPEILTAKPAAGASMSAPGGNPGTTGGNGNGNGNGNGGGNGNGNGNGGGNGQAGVTTSPSSTGTGPATLASSSSTGATSGSGTPAGEPVVPAFSVGLAQTGGNLLRDAEVGAALVAGGWTLHRWASRSRNSALAPSGKRDASGSQGDTA